VATANDVVTPPEERALRAAARASKATGVRIATHTHARLRGGEKQAEILEAEGVAPAHVSLGHSDDSGDFDYLVMLVRRGYTLGMDHVNRGLNADAPVSWKARAALIKQLADAGFVDRMLLSQDTVLGSALLPAELHGEREKTNPDGMFFNTRRLIPHLKQIGMSARQIHAMTVDNPRRLFGGD
jgi:phosphotriesterase-related protein